MAWRQKILARHDKRGKRRGADVRELLIENEQQGAKATQSNAAQRRPSAIARFSGR